MTTTSLQSATRLVSTCREIGPCPLDRLDHLASQSSLVYWHDPGAEYEFRGLGTALTLHGATADRFGLIEDQMRQVLADALLPCPPLGPRWIGGFAFTHKYLSDRVWQAFDPACFVLPHFQLERYGDRFFATINVLADSQDNPQAVQRYSAEALRHFTEELNAREVQEAPVSPGAPERADIEIREPVPKEIWEQSVDRILALIRQGSVRKVVLAQIRELRRALGFDLPRVFQILKQSYPECYVFLFQNGKESAFLGASPELLCTVNGHHLSTMALAGTAPRDSDPVQDQGNRHALARSAKNRHEHRIVIDSLTSTLEQHGARVSPVPETRILSLRNVHHLCTPLQAESHVPRSAVQWASLLHPTAALGGDPRDVAMSCIEELEFAPRGWYGAPFGIVDGKLDGTFTTAIRSGVIHGPRAWLFAGAGIVEGSDPHLEWLETGWKFQTLQQALMA